MLKSTQESFRKLFLLKFTTELIKHSKGEVFYLEHLLKKEKKNNRIQKKVEKNLKRVEVKKNLKEVLSEDNFMKSLPVEEESVVYDIEKRSPHNILMPLRSVMRRKGMPRILRIPEPRLPERLSYLRPIPTNISIDLGVLNSLIKDPRVRLIQCDGPEEEIVVEGLMGIKRTEIILSKEEIDEVLQKFSLEAKIPIDEGPIRIVAGNLILLAITSDVVNTKFVIKKIPNRPLPPHGSMLIR